MKKSAAGIILLIFTFISGNVISDSIDDYRSFDFVHNEVFVKWQDVDGRCGKPAKFLFGDESRIIDNPLCQYSYELSEIPNLELSHFYNHPKSNDGRIIRVKGRFVYNPENAFKSEFYMRDKNLGEKHFGIGYWNDEIYGKIGAFVDSRNVKVNSVDVVSIIQLIDVTDAPTALEHNGNAPFNITILHVEQMK